jgi:hypothetical protein
MKILGCTLSLILLAQLAAAQSLGDLARKERERRAKQQQPVVSVETDELRRGQVELSPPLDPARKGDLEYLLDQLSHPRTTPELLAAFVPLKTQATPRLVPMLSSTDPVKRVAPATVLTVLGDSEGLAAMARMLDDSMAAEAAASPPKKEGEAPVPDVRFHGNLEVTREAGLALNATRLGVWRFTEGRAMTPEQVVQRLSANTPIEVVGGPDNGQRIFNRALHDADANVRLGAITLVRAASGGNDFGFQVNVNAEQNEAAIQQITTFLTTQRAQVMSALAAKR